MAQPGRFVFRPHPALRGLRLGQALLVALQLAASRSPVFVVLAVSSLLLVVVGEVLERTVMDEVGVTTLRRLRRRTYPWSEIQALGAVRGDDRLTMVLADGTRHRLGWVRTSAYQRIPKDWLTPAPEGDKAPALPGA